MVDRAEVQMTAWIVKKDYCWASHTCTENRLSSYRDSKNVESL